MEPFASRPSPGPVEPVPIVGQILARLLSGLVHAERRLADLKVVEECLAECVDIGQLVGDGPPVNLR